MQINASIPVVYEYKRTNRGDLNTLFDRDEQSIQIQNISTKYLRVILDSVLN